MDPRTGKTKVAIDFWCAKFQLGEVSKILIVCPKFVADVWESELATHATVPYEVYHWDQRERKYTANGRGGLPIPHPNRLLVVITNYEAFGVPGRKIPTGKKDANGNPKFRRSTKNGRIKNRNLVREWADHTTGITLDESHRIKSTGGRAAQTLVTLHRDAPYRVIMTGTPITKASRAHDIWMQWKFLNPDRLDEWENFDEFKNYFGRFIQLPDVPVKMWKGARHFEELQALMAKDAFSIARDQCFDLPESDIQIVRVKLSRAAKAYDDMAERMVAYIRQHTAEAPIPLVKVLRLAQITSGHVTTDKGEVITVGREKLDAIMPLIENAVDNGEKIVVAARFRPDLDCLYDAVRRISSRLPIFEIRGGMKRSWVTADLEKARRLTGPCVHIVQPRAASLGIDMSFASRMIWYSLTNSFVDYLQCCDRIALSRISTTFTYMLAGGIDDLLYETLQADGQVARAIIRHPERLRRGYAADE